MPSKKAIKKIIKKRNHKKRNFFRNRGGVNKGTIYVVVIMICLVFAAYIMVGGTLPAKIPKPNNNLVSLIFPPDQPAASSLQLHTFYGATLTPNPTQPTSLPQPTTSVYNPTLIDCGYGASPQQPMIWGYTVDSTPASANTVALKIFYTHTFALSLGTGGNISQMTTHPTDHITNPNVGNTGPSLFLTDITTSLTDKSGDFESGGKANTPSDVYGTWKSDGAPNPAQNQTDLGAGADPWPPANGPSGGHNTNFSSEIIWKLSGVKATDPANKQYVALQSGHTYRGEVILQDGESPGSKTTMCITFKN
jgi:hypothetical protein